MKRRPVALGTLAPFLCVNCRRVLWWSVAHGDVAPRLVDAQGRAHCTPLRWRLRFWAHRLPGTPR